MFFFLLFIIVVLIQVYFYFFLFGNFFNFSISRKTNPKEPVSVIICAKNEENNLEKFLPFIGKQKYLNFEIILVNDSSTDNSLKVMQNFKSEYEGISSISRIHIVSLVENNFGKKYALTKGIEVALNSILLLTDADCKPVSELWIEKMSSNISNEKSVVLGYGAYENIEGSFLNKLIRFETMLTAIQYFSYAVKGIPYMGVGRNLCYRKEEFIQASGFSSHNHIKSGDDDLLVSQIAQKSNTAICIDQESFTVSIPDSNFKSWFKQKRRHITTAGEYKISHKYLLCIFYLSQFLFWILAFIVLAKQQFIFATIGLILLRFFVWYHAIIKSANKLNEKDLIVISPILEFVLICTQLCIFIANKIAPPKYW